MSHRSDPFRRGLSIGLSLLILTLSGAVPLLERADVAAAPVAESEHNPADCPRGHDHTVCTQVGANLSAAASAQHPTRAPEALRTTLRVTVSTAASADWDAGHRSRAPPTA